MPITMKNGKPAIAGTCPSCGTVVFRIGGQRARVGSSLPADNPYEIITLQQNTPEWHEWRHKGIGASDARAAISKPGTRGRAKLLAEKRAPEPPEDSFTTEAMDLGTKLEPEARRLYNERHQTNVRPVCVQSTEYPWLRASLDGLSEDGNLVVEIKCGAGVHQEALEKFPREYQSQVQHILAVTGLPSLHFWCYWPMNPNPEILHVVERDEEYINNLMGKEREFWSEVVGSTNWSPDIEQIIRDPAEATTLDLSQSELTNLPSYIRQRTNLQELNLFGNQLTELPDWIGELTNLTTLDLYANELTELPPGMGNLTNLTFLDLFGNQLTALPAGIGELTNLTELRLSNNQLTALTPGIGNLTNLTELFLSNNQLTALPPAIGNLTGLSWLDLGNNQLTALPPAIGNLTGLSWLDLGNNQLTALPPEIGNLTGLTSLILTNNQLTALPPEIKNLLDQLEVNLSGNPLRG